MPLVTQGTRDTNTSLYLSGHREIPTSPLTTRRSTTFSKAVQGDTNTPLCRTSLPGRYQTLPLTQQRDWHLLSVSPTACAEPNTYSALDWHCTQRIPSPVDTQKRSFKVYVIAMNHWSPNLASYTTLYVPLKHRFIGLQRPSLTNNKYI